MYRNSRFSTISNWCNFLFPIRLRGRASIVQSNDETVLVSSSIEASNNQLPSIINYCCYADGKMRLEWGTWTSPHMLLVLPSKKWAHHRLNYGTIHSHLMCSGPHPIASYIFAEFVILLLLWFRLASPYGNEPHTQNGCTECIRWDRSIHSHCTHSRERDSHTEGNHLLYSTE